MRDWRKNRFPHPKAAVNTHSTGLDHFLPVWPRAAAFEMQDRCFVASDDNRHLHSPVAVGAGDDGI